MSLLENKVSEKALFQVVGRTLDRGVRAYRAALTIDDRHDSKAGRKSLFKGYECLDQITAAQRIGATFPPPAELRDWFDELAARAVAYIDEIEEDIT